MQYLRVLYGFTRKCHLKLTMVKYHNIDSIFIFFKLLTHFKLNFQESLLKMFNVNSCTLKRDSKEKKIMQMKYFYS